MVGESKENTQRETTLFYCIIITAGYYTAHSAYCEHTAFFYRRKTVAFQRTRNKFSISATFNTMDFLKLFGLFVFLHGVLSLEFRYHNNNELFEFLKNFTETTSEFYTRLYSIGQTVRSEYLSKL